MQTTTPTHAVDQARESKYGISYPYPYKGGEGYRDFASGFIPQPLF